MPGGVWCVAGVLEWVGGGETQQEWLLPAAMAAYNPVPPSAAHAKVPMPDQTCIRLLPYTLACRESPIGGFSTPQACMGQPYAELGPHLAAHTLPRACGAACVHAAAGWHVAWPGPACPTSPCLASRRLRITGTTCNLPGRCWSPHADALYPVWRCAVSRGPLMLLSGTSGGFVGRDGCSG